jgi:2-dehydropantoate 2-reductase
VRFAVVGAGAIGAFLGASLVRGGADVVLVARGEHLRAMQTHGVRVESPAGNFTARPPATDDLAAVSDADVVFLGLKAYSLPELAPRLASLLAPGAAVIAGQNGIPWWYFHGLGGPLAGATLHSVDPGGVVDAAIPRSAVIGCVVYPATEIVAPGVIRHIEGNRFQIGEPTGEKSERCRAISEALVAGGLRCPVEARLRDHIWLKLIGNAAFNPVSVLTRATLGQLGELSEMRELLRGLLEESAAVAEALGVRLPVTIDRRLEAGLAVGDHKTSMLQDFEAGKRLELGCMTGAIIEIAGRLGVPMPRTEAVHACVAQLELGAPRSASSTGSS